jgi:hypothetical protein
LREAATLAAFLTDQQIADLLAERKVLPSDWRRRLTLKAKRGHTESELEVEGVQGSEFRLMQRRSEFNPLDFSVILAYRVPGSNQVMRLKRYNGKSHEHSNPIERQRFYDFHIHTATERYQRTGNKEETFAEVTDRYSNVDEATKCLFEDCNFDVPEQAQGELF